jgi:hypothetical protein
MSKLQKYMVVHNNPGIDCNVVQANWRKLAAVEDATWIRTFFNDGKGIRYCLWFAQDAEQLENIFKEMNVTWESIIPVQETAPDLWGEKWQEHIEAEKSADTLGL